MGLFRKKTVTKTYDKENKKSVIKASICNGEQAMPLSQLFEVLFDSSVVVKYPIF